MATLSAKYNVIPPLASQSSATKELGYCTQKLWSNHQLVNRLLYRSHNQHRASFALHRLKEVRSMAVMTDGGVFTLHAFIGEAAWGADSEA